MTKDTKATPRRTRVPGDKNSGIYRTSAGRLEVGYRDGSGRQRWQTIPGGILEARRVRDDLLSRRARGERVSPNPKLKFSQAADEWEAKHVANLRPRSAETYKTHLKRLRDRFGADRLDRITADDMAKLVKDMRQEGKAEWTVQGTLSTTNSVFRFATRRLGWAGSNPVAELLPSERAKVSTSKRKVIFSEEQIAATIAAASEPYRTTFLVAGRTGARVSEILGLTWGDVDLLDLDDATVSFTFQIARDGVTRTPTKTDGSARVLPIDRTFAEHLANFRMARALDGLDTGDTAFIFSTKSGRAVNQRNIGRELRAAQRRATLPDGRAAFPVLRETMEGPKGKPVPVPVPAGVVPSMHSFRHSYVSYALHNGGDLHEVALDVGHSSTRTTQQVYRHVIDDAKRRANKRAQMAARHGSIVEAHEATRDDTSPTPAA